MWHPNTLFLGIEYTIQEEWLIYTDIVSTKINAITFSPAQEALLEIEWMRARTHPLTAVQHLNVTRRSKTNNHDTEENFLDINGGCDVYMKDIPTPTLCPLRKEKTKDREVKG